MRFIQIFIVSSILVSCSSSKVEKAVTGWWTIDEINFNEQDMKFDILGNTLTFKDDGKCRLPKTRVHSNIQIYDEEGTWKIIKNKEGIYVLEITSDNEMFKGTHPIYFKKNIEDRMLMMVIESSSLSVISRKGLLHFESNEDFIDELVELTNARSNVSSDQD